MFWEGSVCKCSSLHQDTVCIGVAGQLLQWSLDHPSFAVSYRKFGYVDFASEEDMQKAMELNGKKVMGQELKLDMPRSKETAQEDKKGKDLCLMGGEKF